MPPTRTNDNSSSTVLQRFEDIAQQHDWEKEEYIEKRREFIVAEVGRIFSETFDELSRLEAWRKLCKTIGISGAQNFASVTKCKEARRGKFVNIVDLVDAVTAGTTCQSFASAKALRNYIRRTKKFYPLDEAKRDGLLKEFLIQV